ncbi:MAG: hypothetical protein K2H95_00705, partial [Bacteroidales bacterium]|nr:hypothetical protein [Bacteroidales bacterium]
MKNKILFCAILLMTMTVLSCAQNKGSKIRIIRTERSIEMIAAEGHKQIRDYELASVGKMTRQDTDARTDLTQQFKKQKGIELLNDITKTYFGINSALFVFFISQQGELEALVMSFPGENEGDTKKFPDKKLKKAFHLIVNHIDFEPWTGSAKYQSFSIL